MKIFATLSASLLATVCLAIGCDRDSGSKATPVGEAASGTANDPTNATTGGGAMPGSTNGSAGGLNGPTTRASSTGSGMNGGGATGTSSPKSRATGDAGSGAVDINHH